MVGADEVFEGVSASDVEAPRTAGVEVELTNGVFASLVMYVPSG